MIALIVFLSVAAGLVTGILIGRASYLSWVSHLATERNRTRESMEQVMHTNEMLTETNEALMRSNDLLREDVRNLRKNAIESMSTVRRMKATGSSDNN